MLNQQIPAAFLPAVVLRLFRCIYGFTGSTTEAMTMMDRKVCEIIS